VRDISIFWWAVAFEAGLGAVAWALGWWFERPPLATFRWDVPGLVAGILATLPMLLGFWACVRWPIGPLARIKDFSDEVVRPLFARCSVLQLGIIALAAGFGEEMLFRGFLQAMFSDWWGVAAGIAAASLIFGLMHIITITYAVLAALLGVYLGIVWLHSGNLLSVVLAHALYDFIALVYLVKAEGPVAATES
jgi:membrane protease YdiL (CAAX protease family)